MPRIFDNIESHLVGALHDTLEVAQRADFCVGYFNLRGWRQIDECINNWSGEDGNCCRLLVGMQRPPEDIVKSAFAAIPPDDGIGNKAAIRLKRELAEAFRVQLSFGTPTNQDEAGLRRLAAQLKARKVRVKLFLRHPLHAKLYLLFRNDVVNPAVGFVGSSNLTLSGLGNQGELNVDVMDHDACDKLALWFDARWNDAFCIDISDELVDVIEQSWARESLIPPYHIYVKMAYHLSREARVGLNEFRIPREFGNTLFEFQTAAVKIAAHHVMKRGGVLIGDVVGLGKTLMATALAKILEDDHDFETLIICPVRLKPMWEDYREKYRLRAKVVPISQVGPRFVEETRRYRVVLIDESHNLRNREGSRYRFLREYIQKNESRCILLSATPYNKTYKDLSNQLRLFIPEDKLLGVRPERLLKALGETEFRRKHQCAPHSLSAFDHSPFADDWRDLMRLYLVRRTRSFIKTNYAKFDTTSDRHYLTFADGRKSYFPIREPKTVKFAIRDGDPDDQYARLFSQDVVDIINHLRLPRYGMGNYVAPTPQTPPSQKEDQHLRNLSRAGKRLMGFCRTNLFKRLESSGQAFIQSIERHILRNFVFVYALRNRLPLPLGTQDVGVFDSRVDDADAEGRIGGFDLFEDDGAAASTANTDSLRSEADFLAAAKAVYEEYERRYKSRFVWLRPDLFVGQLTDDLVGDAQDLLKVLGISGEWRPSTDAKLRSLLELVKDRHPTEKVLVFSQFADTVRYLEKELARAGVENVVGVTGDTDDPTKRAWQFSPQSNDKSVQVGQDETRVLLATDVLSEGQNLQDCAIVVNFDLPWAIIRLIQRAGRVDRIGQRADTIRCYSFIPADGVERIIRLRSRVRQRLQENAEVVGTDESFFEDDPNQQVFKDLYNEKSGILDGEEDAEIDLGSYAFQIWKNAIDQDPRLERTIIDMPDVVFATKAHEPTTERPEGVLVYVQMGDDTDALAWVDKGGTGITESQLQILKAAECPPETTAQPRSDWHHEAVRAGVTLIGDEDKQIGGQLGRPSGARFRVYERLQAYVERVRGTLFETDALKRAIQDIHNHPLRESAKDILNRQLRIGLTDEMLVQLVSSLRDEDKLCVPQADTESTQPRIICSMGLSRA